jgi:hypothetical protein
VDFDDRPEADRIERVSIAQQRFQATGVPPKSIGSTRVVPSRR